MPYIWIGPNNPQRMRREDLCRECITAQIDQYLGLASKADERGLYDVARELLEWALSRIDDLEKVAPFSIKKGGD
jgi:hypothetical protein